MVIIRYRLVNKQFLVRCFWTVKEKIAGSDQLVLYKVMQPLKCNLRQLILEKRSSNGYLDIHHVISCIVEGLEFLHHRELVHHDLSIDTIAVSKLCRHQPIQ